MIHHKLKEGEQVDPIEPTHWETVKQVQKYQFSDAVSLLKFKITGEKNRLTAVPINIVVRKTMCNVNGVTHGGKHTEDILQLYSVPQL